MFVFALLFNITLVVICYGDALVDGCSASMAFRLI